MKLRKETLKEVNTLGSLSSLDTLFDTSVTDVVMIKHKPFNIELLDDFNKRSTLPS